MSITERRIVCKESQFVAFSVIDIIYISFVRCILYCIYIILDPILLKNTYRVAGIEYLKLGESELQWHPDFRFYITTRLRNPHYLPEVAVKVSMSLHCTTLYI